MPQFIRLSSLLNRDIVPQQEWKTRLLTCWPEIVGNLDDRISLERIEKNRLIIGVPSSTWMNELHLISNEFLHQINQKLGSQIVKELKFIRKPLKRHLIPQPRGKAPVDAQELQKMKIPDAVVASIDDEELKRYMKKFLCNCAQNCQRHSKQKGKTGVRKQEDG